MNKVILLGRLTKDPDVRYSSGENSTAVARCRLYRMRCFRPSGRICREISAAGNEDRHHRPDPNRKLYEP